MIPDRKGLHAACVVNQYRVPDLKSTLCTREFLLKIKDGQIYNPKVTEMHRRQCLNPPPVQVLHDMLCSTIEENFALIPDDKRPMVAELRRQLIKGKADKKWYLDILAAMTEGTHEVFNRNYKPPPKVKPIDEGFTVANPDGFFDDLEVSKKRGTGSILLTNEQREQRALKRIELQNANMKLRLQKQQEKLEKARKKDADQRALY